MTPVNPRTKWLPFLLPVFGLLLISFAGCGKWGLAEVTVADPEDQHAHSHGEDDALIWVTKEKVADTEMEIWLGHHGTHFHPGDMIEPSVAITMGGKAYADAQVFNQIVDSTDTAKTMGDEVATVYEPETPEEIAHYAQGELAIPIDAGDQCTIRFRVLPGEGADEIVRDITIKLGH